jgi:hypothetical protein
MKVTKMQDGDIGHFVLVAFPSSLPFPLKDGDDIAFFSTREEAIYAAERNRVATTYGFEIYLWRQ